MDPLLPYPRARGRGRFGFARWTLGDDQFCNGEKGRARKRRKSICKRCNGRFPAGKRAQRRVGPRFPAGKWDGRRTRTAFPGEETVSDAAARGGAGERNRFSGEKGCVETTGNEAGGGRGWRCVAGKRGGRQRRVALRDVETAGEMVPGALRGCAGGIGVGAAQQETDGCLHRSVVGVEPDVEAERAEDLVEHRRRHVCGRRISIGVRWWAALRGRGTSKE